MCPLIINLPTLAWPHTVNYYRRENSIRRPRGDVFSTPLTAYRRTRMILATHSGNFLLILIQYEHTINIIADFFDNGESVKCNRRAMRLYMETCSAISSHSHHLRLRKRLPREFSMATAFVVCAPDPLFSRKLARKFVAGCARVLTAILSVF